MLEKIFSVLPEYSRQISWRFFEPYINFVTKNMPMNSQELDCTWTDLPSRTGQQEVLRRNQPNSQRRWRVQEHMWISKSDIERSSLLFVEKWQSQGCDRCDSKNTQFLVIAETDSNPPATPMLAHFARCCIVIHRPATVMSTCRRLQNATNEYTSHVSKE